MENSAKDLKEAAAIKELIKGQEFAVRLSMLVQKAWSGDSSAAGGLIEEVMSSFSRALHVLSSDASGQNPVEDEICIDEVKSDASGMKRKNIGAGRGGSRKRKHASQWRTVVSKTISDEYSWRKYGQKVIHSSKFPRSYFRCTHKHDQGCQATKQVQKSEDDPSLLVTSYMGEHTCTNNHNIIPKLIIPSNSNEPSIISFGSNTSNVTHDFSLPSSPLFSKRPENEEEVLSNPMPNTPSSDFFDLLEPLMTESALQRRDEIASNLDMSFVLDSLNFEDDVFAFDQGHLFRD